MCLWGCESQKSPLGTKGQCQDLALVRVVRVGELKSPHLGCNLLLVLVSNISFRREDLT